MKKILIVDDDLNFVKNIFNYINNSTGNKFIVSNISINGEEAYKNLITNSFDIMILDLKMPKLNGLELINKIKDIKNFPEIIIITGDPYLMQELVRLNIPISEILTKPFDFDKLIDKLNIIEEKIKNNDFITKISELLNNFYFNKSSPGYLYIVECIKICLNKNSLITPFEKELYKIIANENNAKSNLHVKWAIDKSISTMNKYTTPSVLNDFFPYSRPTSKIFITEMFNILNNNKIMPNKLS